MNMSGASKGDINVKISNISMKDKLAQALKANINKQKQSADRLSNVSSLSQK